MEDIESRIIEVIADEIGCKDDEINRKTNIVDDLGADSLDFVNILEEIESEFDILIADDEAEGVRTVDQIVDLIRLKLL